MPLKFPIRIKRLRDQNGEMVQVAIIDALDRQICLHCEAKELRREVAKLWSPEEAEDLAVHIARFLSDRWAEQVVIHQNSLGENKR